MRLAISGFLLLGMLQVSVCRPILLAPDAHMADTTV